MLVGEVARLSAILIDVVELPAIFIEVTLTADRRVHRGRLPAVLPDTAGAQHRVVLTLLLGGCLRGVEAVAHGHTVDRILIDPAVDLGHLQANNLKDGRYDIGGVVVLVTHLALGFDALGPVDHHRIAGTAGVLRVTLEHLERGGERRGPARRVVVVSLGSAELVVILEVLLEAVRIAVEELVLIDRSVRSALPGCAVVGTVEDQRVLQLTGLLEVVDDPADLDIGVFREPGEHFCHPREQRALVFIELSPRPDMVVLIGHVLGHRVQRGEFGALRHHTPLDHPGQDPIPVGLVAVVELALVFLDVLLRRVVRGVVGTWAEPHVPRLRRGGRVLITQHPQGLVREILG